MKLVAFYLNNFTNDTHFSVSDEDYEEVIKYKWKLCAPDRSGNHYVGLAGSVPTRVHRFLLKIIDIKVRVDHKNMNLLDNTRENLRVCNASLNAANKKVQRNKKSSKFKGVFKRGKKFRAMIGFNNKLIHLGSYNTEKEAATVYNKKAVELFGEFAQINILEN